MFEGTLIDQCIDSFYGDDDEDGPSSSDEFCFLESGVSDQVMLNQTLYLFIQIMYSNI